MMTSIWSRWNRPSTNARNTTNDHCSHGGGDSGCSSIKQNEDSPPRKIHVGLSIDSDSTSDKSETSSLSDFEDGMPLWARHTPPRVLIPPPTTPIGFQLRLPKRGAALSLNTTDETRTQRTTFFKSNLSLPILNNDHHPHARHGGVRLQQRNNMEHSSNIEDSSLPFPLRTTIKSPRLLKLFFALMAMGMLAASFNQKLYSEIMMNEPPTTDPATTHPNFPNFHLQQQPQSSSPSKQQQQQQQRRSNLALARSQESLPVFGNMNETESTSDSWISWLGGCAFCLVLLETGWKGYRQSRLSQQQEAAAAARRL